MFNRAPSATGCGSRQVELLLRPRQSHVRKSAFLCQFTFIIHRPLVWECAVFKSGDKHVGELEALGGVNGHEGNLAPAFRFAWDLICIGNQCNAFEEGPEVCGVNTSFICKVFRN